MDDRDDKKTNKKHHSKVWDTISFWLTLCAILLPWILGISLLIAGLSALIDKEPFLFVLKEMFLSLLSSVLLYPVIVFVLFAVAGLLIYVLESHPIICIVLIIAIAVAFPAGSNAIKKNFSFSGNHFTKKDVQTQWNHFEKVSRLGDEYKQISEDYNPLSDEFIMDGGVFLKGSNGLYYAFPKYSKSEISDIDPCTGMLGTAEDLFGYNEDVSLSSFKESLGLTSETEYEGTLNYKKASSSGYYYVTIRDEYIKNDADYITPDTWISVTPRNRSIVAVGRLVNDQSEEEIVFYVDGGNRYHKDASCTTLHDSDTIYECYIDDVPDSRTPCDVCY